MFDKEKYEGILEAFTIHKEMLQEITAAFRYDVELGLRKPGESSLRMLKSYVGLPDGTEKGEYLALDFGGTNVRVLRIRLLGNGQYEICRKVSKPLVVPGVYDFAGQGSKAEDLFDFIAGIVDEVIEENHGEKYLLGHTFSFPSVQNSLNEAKLILWTKEFATAGVEGEDVNRLLKKALVRNGIPNVEPVAVINDTVAVLLAAAYKQADTYMGSIYATGHNTCYYEPFTDEALPGMILNMESGGFSKLLPNSYDNMLDEVSEKPGEQRLEKMVSGRYMGELFGVALGDLWGTEKQYLFTSIDMSGMLLDTSDGARETAKIVREQTGMELCSIDCALVRNLARAIVVRSARLVTATYVGVIWHLAGKGSIRKQHIAIDGSVYEKMPFARENILKAFYDILGEDAAQVDLVLENGGSGLGAAIAAAISQK
jgi:hexokinase